MLINHLLALPPLINSIGQALPSYEVGTTDWDITLDSEVGTDLFAVTHYNNGAGSLQFWANWKNAVNDAKELKVKIIGYEPEKQQEAVIYEDTIKIGEVATFDINGEKRTIEIFAPFWRIEFVEMTGAIPPTNNNIIFHWAIKRC